MRLLWLGAKVLILDEPTTGISAAQRAQLFDALRRLAAEGKTVIFVSHKLEEVRGPVHQGGRVSARDAWWEKPYPPSASTALVSMMFDREVTPGPRMVCAPGAPLVKLSGVSAEQGRIQLAGA